MLHTHDAISYRGGRRVFRSAVLAMLTLAAMLLCLLAVHSAGTGHGLSAAAAPATTAMTAGAHSAAAHAASSAAPLPGTVLERIAPATTTVVAVVAVAAVAAGTTSSAGTHALSGLATLSMTCSVLLVLGALILLSRRPSAFRRLLEACGYTPGSFREIPLHLHRPSLTLLSISRI